MDSSIHTSPVEWASFDARVPSGSRMLQQFIRYAPVAVAVFDRDMRYLEVSDRWLSAFHLERQAILGRSQYEVFPDVPDRWKAVYRRALDGAIERSVEDRFERANGEVEWLRWEVRPWHMPEGAVGGVMILAEVITGEKQKEAERQHLMYTLGERVKELTALHQIARLLQGDRSIDGRLLADVAATLPPATQYPGVAAGRVTYREFAAATPGWCETPWQQTARFTTGPGRHGTVTIGYLYAPPRGAGDPFLAEERLLLESIAEMLAAHLQRGEAQAELRQSEARYRELVDGVRDVIIALTPEGGIAALNPVFESITGHVRADWIGRPLSALLHPDDASALGPELRAVLDGAERPPVQYRLLAADGSLRLGEFYLTSMRRDGVATGVLGIARDVTGRVQLEDRLRQAQRMEAVGRLAGGVAHDFNNLLTAIMGYSELLAAELDPDHAGQADVTEIQKAADRAVSLTRQLLAFSRQQVLEPRVLDLNDLIVDVERMLQRLVGEDVTFTVTLDPRAGLVRADPGQIEQVLMNLVVNARDATPAAGRVTVATAHVELTEASTMSDGTTLPGGPYVSLTVADTGMGIDAATRARLLEPFFTTKPPGRGTGLGLSTVYGIVQQSGGALGIDSEPGRGAVFTVYLPRVAATEASIDEEDTLALRGTETILVVEDDAGVLQITREMLARLGYQVIAALGPDAALECESAHDAPLDLLLTDVMMPGRNGRELAEVLLARRPQLRVMFMSGHSADAIVRNGILESGAEYVQKPFTSGVLARHIRAALDAPSGWRRS